MRSFVVAAYVFAILSTGLPAFGYPVPLVGGLLPAPGGGVTVSISSIECATRVDHPNRLLPKLL